MACGFTDYTVFYRWEWFRRVQWRGTFRRKKRHSSGAFVELVRERGLRDEPVLDCSCGLGLKTIVMKEAGVSVFGFWGQGLEHWYRQLIFYLMLVTVILTVVSGFSYVLGNKRYFEKDPV